MDWRDRQMSDIKIAAKAFTLMLMVLLSLWASYLITVNVFVYLHDIAHEQSQESRDGLG